MFRVNAERMVNIGGVDLAKFLEWLHAADDFPQGALRQKIRAWFLYLKSTSTTKSTVMKPWLWAQASVTSAKFWNWQAATV